MSTDLLNVTVPKTTSSFAYLTDFSDFLSFQETLNSLIQLFDQIQNTQNIGDFQTGDFQTGDPTSAQIAALIDAHSERILSLLQNADDADYREKIKLLEPVKTAVKSSPKILGNKKHFQHLKFMLLQSAEIHTESSSVQPSSSLNAAPTFENALMNASLNEELVDAFVFDLKNAVQNFGTDPIFMQELLCALQKDYIQLSNRTFQKCNGLAPDVQIQATSLLGTLFPLLVDLAKKDLSYVSKNIVDFSFEITNANEEFRVISWTQWRWIRVLATHTWDSSLREPPSWVIAGGSLYCAILFDCADSIWLQEYAHLVLERVYAETLVDSFEPTQQHYDYVEFLARNLKKKSPYFASHPYTNLALKILSRLTPRELMREGNSTSGHAQDLNIEKIFAHHKNPVSQALGVLFQMTSV